MNNSNNQSEELFQRVFTHRLSRTCQSLQRLEQQMMLIGHRSDQIISMMKKVRQDILNRTSQKR